MEEVRRETGIQEVWDQIETGVGFVVGGHNYGRLDRLSDEELEKIKGYVGTIASDASRLLDGIALMENERTIA